MGTERVSRLMRQYAIPCIISLLVGALYNIVDQIFIANASYLGSYGNAANTVVFPLTVVALAIAVMVGDGCCAFVSMALGRNEVDKARRSVGNAVVLSIAGSLVLTVVYLLFADGIIAMFGGTVNEETFHHSREYFFYSIVVGMAAGCIPIVGYNMGAEKKLRVRELFTRLLAAEALVGAAALILAEGFPRQLIAIFGAANESVYYTDFAIKAFRVYLCMMVLACVNKACFIFLQAVGKALSSTLLSMFREVVFGVGFALLLPVFFGLDGVLYSMPVSDILTFIISAVIIVKTYRELNMEGAQIA